MTTDTGMNVGKKTYSLMVSLQNVSISMETIVEVPLKAKIYLP